MTTCTARVVATAVVVHDDHLDYLHDGHWHAAHDSHYDEHLNPDH